MHYEEWSASRFAAALGALEDAGLTQSRLARLAGVHRSQVNRWSRGENRPGYDPVRRLAVATWRQHPGIARELVEASGYPWAEPAATEPPIPPDVLRVISRYYSPDQQREVIEKLGEVGPPEGDEAAGPA
jgi:transcriptional regulator with XRE-family HTH domain